MNCFIGDLETVVRVVRTQSMDVRGLGQAIKRARLKDGRPLRQICAQVGMTTANWYRIESENQTLPLETLRNIEEILGVSFGVIFENS